MTVVIDLDGVSIRTSTGTSFSSPDGVLYQRGEVLGERYRDPTLRVNSSAPVSPKLAALTPPGTGRAVPHAYQVAAVDSFKALRDDRSYPEELVPLAAQSLSCQFRTCPAITTREYLHLIPD